ncbi:hypothetical protein MHA_0037 [Mannheimia haemolytica PHL213]|nr:hypothetical protein MHA_0037 [Mannheimia haemolytica PHL213]
MALLSFFMIFTKNNTKTSACFTQIKHSSSY